MATTTTTIVVEEGKLLSESLSTVKIQVGQMKRHLVSAAYPFSSFDSLHPALS
jgi:hypothetical protein